MIEVLFIYITDFSILVKFIIHLYFLLSASPKSRVSWWVNGEMIDATFEEIAPGKSRNTMKV